MKKDLTNEIGYIYKIQTKNPPIGGFFYLNLLAIEDILFIIDDGLKLGVF